MLDLATSDHESLRVETCELDRAAPSYTVDTLRTLTRSTAGAHFTLIVGSDAALSIENWREISEVRRMAEIRILGRPGETAAGEPAGAVPFPGLAISSTQIRDAIKARRSIRYLTPEAVRLYIEEKGLYQ